MTDEPRNADVEAVAEALWRADIANLRDDETWDREAELRPDSVRHYRHLAEAAITTLAARDPDDDAAQ